MSLLEFQRRVPQLGGVAFDQPLTLGSQVFPRVGLGEDFFHALEHAVLELQERSHRHRLGLSGFCLHADLDAGDAAESQNFGAEWLNGTSV